MVTLKFVVIKLGKEKNLKIVKIAKETRILFFQVVHIGTTQNSD